MLFVLIEMFCLRITDSLLQMIKPQNGDTLPKLPEPEAATLKVHLKQVG